jgi:hypothetical protein
MSYETVTPPALGTLTLTDKRNLIYIDVSGNLSTTTITDMYNSFPIINNLLVVNNGNFSVIPNNLFNPCSFINGNKTGRPNPTTGKCVCNNYWTGDACNICDVSTNATPNTHTDNSYGSFAGPNCDYSAAVKCNGKGLVNKSGVCQCRNAASGSDCTGNNCEHGGTPSADGSSCVGCQAVYNDGNLCKVLMCQNGSVPNASGTSCICPQITGYNGSTLRSPWGGTLCDRDMCQNEGTAYNENKHACKCAAYTHTYKCTGADSNRRATFEAGQTSENDRCQTIYDSTNRPYYLSGRPLSDVLTGAYCP